MEKIQENKRKLKEEEEYQNKLASEYIKKNVAGKGQKEVLWTVKDDFYKYA